MGYGLCAVNDYGNVVLMCHSNHLLHRIDSTQYIGNVRNGNHFRTFFKQFLITIQVQDTLVVHRYNKQLPMVTLDHLLPRHEVGVMLHRSY